MSGAGYGVMKKIQGAATGCEPLWLLGMEGEYIGFLVSLESEIRVLEHIAGCESCRSRIRRVVEAAEGEDELDEMWHPSLPEWIGASTPVGRDCPRREDHADVATFIDARTSWRINALRVIKADAELELGHLSDRIKESQNPSP